MTDSGTDTDSVAYTNGRTDTDSATGSGVGSGAGTAAAPGARVDALFSRGRLVSIPRKQGRREQLLRHLATTLFEPGRAYSEREVNEALLTVHDDFPALRRHLVTSGLLDRTRDGSSYRLAS